MSALPETRPCARPPLREQLVRVVERAALHYRGLGSSIASTDDSLARAFVGGVAIHLELDGRVRLVVEPDAKVDWTLASVVARDIHRDAAGLINFYAESEPR